MLPQETSPKFIFDLSLFLLQFFFWSGMGPHKTILPGRPRTLFNGAREEKQRIPETIVARALDWGYGF